MASMMESIGAAMKGKLSAKDKKKLADRDAARDAAGTERLKREPDALANDVKAATSPFSYLFKKKPAKK